MKKTTFKFPISLTLLILSVQMTAQQPKLYDSLKKDTSASTNIKVNTKTPSSLKNMLSLNQSDLENQTSARSVPGDAFVIEEANFIGMNIMTTGSNAIQVCSAGIDGLQVQIAGRDGLRVSASGHYGINVTGTKGAALLTGKVTVNGDLTASNMAINTSPVLNTRISVQGNTAFSGNMVLTSGFPTATFARSPGLDNRSIFSST